MGNSSELEICLRSKWKDKSEVVAHLSPSEYFDPLEDGEARFECDSTPIHDRLVEYLTLAKDSLEYVEVEIYDPSNEKRHVRREIFWNDNWMSVATNYENGFEISTEVILEISESQTGISQLIKFDKHANDIRLVMHLLLRSLSFGEIESVSIL